MEIAILSLLIVIIVLQLVAIANSRGETIDEIRRETSANKSILIGTLDEIDKREKREAREKEELAFYKRRREEEDRREFERERREGKTS